MTERDLLLAYEPILRFTRGELFFPMAVEPYVRECDLWTWVPGHGPKLLAPYGSLDLDTLARIGDSHRDRPLYLRYVQEPLTGTEYRRWRRELGEPFHAPGRLARVGLLARLIDAVFSLSFLLRGSVPGGTAAAAAVKYQRALTERREFVYYGRVLRSDGYIVLQYLFFYAMNDWRSSFHGANDHEADWEQVLIFLEDRGDEPPIPAWVAFSAHAGSGDDLRRRWDDPGLHREGNHVVAFVGAGSHANYFCAGEYLTEVEVRYLQPVLRAVRRAERFWRETLRQGDSTEVAERVESFISVPFVDYARGDGFSIGPDQQASWSQRIIDDGTPWVDRYRGLWGKETRDPFAGEQSPAGPKFYPDGTVRRSWFDPLGWVGLDKVAPRGKAAEVLARRIAELEGELAGVETEITELRDALPRLELEVRALRCVHHLAALHRERQAILAEGEARLQALQDRRLALTETIEASQNYLQGLSAGALGDPRLHLRRVPRPQTPGERHQSRLAEAWAALSVSVTLIGVVVVVMLGIWGWLPALVLLLGMGAVVEATLRRRLHRLLLNATVLLAIAAAALLIYEYASQLIVLGILALATLILADNVRELRGG